MAGNILRNLVAMDAFDDVKKAFAFHCSAQNSNAMESAMNKIINKATELEKKQLPKFDPIQQKRATISYYCHTQQYDRALDLLHDMIMADEASIGDCNDFVALLKPENVVQYSASLEKVGQKLATWINNRDLLKLKRAQGWLTQLSSPPSSDTAPQ